MRTKHGWASGVGVSSLAAVVVVVGCRSGSAGSGGGGGDGVVNDVRPALGAGGYDVGAGIRPGEETRLIEAIRAKEAMEGGGEPLDATSTRVPVISGPREGVEGEQREGGAAVNEAERRERDGLPDPVKEGGGAFLDPAGRGNSWGDEAGRVLLAPPSGATQTIGGMLGQVNGQAIYAEQVLRPLEPMLLAHAQTDAPAEFEKVVKVSVRLRLRELVENALLLGEAERDLTASERLGLAEMTRRQRKELIRRYGQNSLAVAEQEIQKQEGRSLAEAVRQWREGKTVGTYVNRKIRPKVNVTRADIERYFREHPDEFNPPPTRVVRLLVTTSPEARDQAAAALAGGGAFEAVAAGDVNTYKRDEAGLWNKGEASVVVFNPAVDEAIADLEAGQWAGPVEDGQGRWWFVKVESVERGEAVPLRDAQMAIEQKLSAQQFRGLEGRFRARLLEEGSYTSLEDMERAAVEVAVARFGPGPRFNPGAGAEDPALEGGVDDEAMDPWQP